MIGLILAGAPFGCGSNQPSGGTTPGGGDPTPGGGDTTSPGGGGDEGGGGGDEGGGGEGGGGGGTVTCVPSWTPTADCGGLAPASDPDLGPNVILFDPAQGDGAMQSRIDQLYQQQDAAQFGDGRYALLFKPGHYNLDVKVGFYTQVLGLGQSPDEVAIDGAVRVKADWLGDNNATCNFWRGAENFKVTPAGNIDGGKNVWATSQATHLRRIHVAGDLNLWDGGWSSGGFISDSLIEGTVDSGTQQQYLTRNNDQHWTGQNWNMVFVGDKNAPQGGWPNPPYSVVAQTPRVREKPFLYIDPTGHYSVMVPSLKTDTQGHSWAAGAPPGLPLSISRFYVARPGSDTADTLNAALASGKHLLFTPGNYHLNAPLKVDQPNTVLLGLGLATLIPDEGTAAIQVADVDGVTLAGLLLDAGSQSSPVMLELGPAGSSTSHAANPTLLADLHCRVGGAHDGRAEKCFVINSHDVIGDNLWLWRADHGTGAAWDGNVSANGLQVNGDNVVIYGLFCEHFQQYQTLWNGNGGAVYFYQSELPYDPPNQDSWRASPGHDGWASYKVAGTVTSHTALGLGIYSVFYNDVTEANAVESPTGAALQLHHLMTVSLNKGRILHILNDQGGTVGTGGGFSAYLQE